MSWRGLTGRMVAAGLVLVLLTGLSFVVLDLAIRDLSQANHQVDASAAQLRAADEAQQLVIDMETGLRGFVITGDERFLASWDAGRQGFPRRIAALEAAAGDPGQRARVQAIADASGSYVDEYGLPLIEAVRSDDPSAMSVSMTELGKQRVDDLRSLLSAFTEAERQIYLTRQEAASELARTATMAAVVGFALSVGLIVLVIIYLARTLVRPITNAARMAGRLEDGDLSARMPGTGTAEIGTLERSFNSLATTLEESRAVQARLLDQQSALRRLAVLVAQSREPDEVFSAVVRELSTYLPSDAACLWRHESDGSFVPVATWDRHGGPLAASAFRAEDGVVGRAWASISTTRIDASNGPAILYERLGGLAVTSSIACPVVVDGERWGVLEAARCEGSLAVDAETWMTAFTELVGTATSNAKARADVAASRRRIVAASDEARRRIERDLHDGAQQLLVSLGLRLRMASAMVSPEEPQLRTEIEQIAEDVTTVIDELREMSHGIYPAALARAGLPAAVRTLARRSPIPVELDIRAGAELSQPLQAAAYYVVAEALTNAVKHASAEAIHITLEDRQGQLRVVVRDDGVGGADPTSGSGITGLRDRVEALGGRLEVDSPPGTGTVVQADIPVR